jgi:membrane-associated protease RseP (regulator of RpoE activity)
MVVIHEFGHFIVAKMLGIGVEVFSVGFGPRLLGFKYGDTDYRFSAVPLGGYVRFRGENLEMLQGKSDAPADEFNSHPKWKRFLVALAGPAFQHRHCLIDPDHWNPDWISRHRRPQPATGRRLCAKRFRRSKSRIETRR